MREIKFRALLINKKDWVYGDLVHKAFDGYRTFDVGIKIPNCFADEVIAKSIGQYTGLKDKNGVEIYEGDICRHTIDFFENGNISFDKKRVVVFDKGCFSFDESSISIRPATGHFIEVIGNVHQNPELL